MPRTANPNTPVDENGEANGKQIATKVAPEVERKARLLAILDSKSLADWLRDLVTNATAGLEVQATRNGETVSM